MAEFVSKDAVKIKIQPDMNEIRRKDLDLILIDGGKFYLEKNLPFLVTVICKETD
jgi:hypothetical protein